jgi:hypothetical protein
MEFILYDTFLFREMATPKMNSIFSQETIGAGNNRFLRTTRSSTTTESSDAILKPDREIPVDENGRIRPYVDFSHFHREWNKFKNSQKS